MLECAVVSAPDKTLGEAPVAIVVLKQGASATTKELREPFWKGHHSRVQ